MDEALDPVLQGRVEQGAGTLDIGSVDILGRVEGQCGGGMYHNVYACHRLIHRFAVADITLDDADLVEHIGVVVVGNVEGDEAVATLL